MKLSKEWGWDKERYYWKASLLSQIALSKAERDKWYYIARGLSEKRGYIESERAKLTTRMWYAVMWEYHWTCTDCHVTNFLNKDLLQVKMEVDHNIPLFHNGKTVWKNLYCRCKRDNSLKGTMMPDEWEAFKKTPKYQKLRWKN